MTQAMIDIEIGDRANRSVLLIFDDEPELSPIAAYIVALKCWEKLGERNYVRGNGRQFWFIIEDEKHIPIGKITYFNIDYRLGHVEVGLRLGEKTRWGKGYGPDAIRTLVRYLFTFPGIMRVYAETALANHPARSAFIKAHFSEVGQIYDPRSTGEPWILLERWKSDIV